MTQPIGAPMRRFLPALTALSLALAGCGTTHTPSPVHTTTVLTTPSTPTPKAVQGRPCDPTDSAHWSLQCALPPSPHTLTVPLAVRSIQGEDFAWGAPSCATIKARGQSFGAGYLDHDQGKQWTQTPGLYASYHRQGCATVSVWETTADRATQGFSAGQSDAREAAGQANSLGNARDAIDFAVDCDCPGSQILGYFQGVHSVLGSRDNAYGGYDQVNYLYGRHVVGHLNWQTYAWSGGRWLPASVAPLEQYQNGSAFDYDRAIAANYGQSPAPVTCDSACQKRAHDARVRKETAHLHALLRERTVLRTHLLWSRRGFSCRVKHPRPSCRPLFLRGQLVNREINLLRSRGIR